MTFTEIVQAASDRLNLTSPEATARIGRSVNDRYRRVTSSIGLQTSRRTTATANTSAGSPSLTFALEKLEVIYDTTSGQRRVLSEITYDEWRNSNVYANPSGTPRRYAVKSADASSVTIVLDPVPASVSSLSADGLASASSLSGSQVPAFPADFHDALVHGAVADELRKQEKPALALEAEKQHEQRLSDLRMFLAKSSYLDIVQGARAGRWPDSRWSRW
jgi:hypothetical protein